MELYTRIIAISLLSNEIEIGGPLFSKIHQMALSMFKNASNKKKRPLSKTNFLRFTTLLLAQKDSSTPKVLKLHFVSVKHGSASISNIVLLTFDIKAEPFLTETKCYFKTFGVNESFWARQQSCIS